MTFRERLKLEHPEYVNEKYLGGCRGCPINYGYEDELPNCLFVECEECWNREFPGSEALNCSETPYSSDLISRQAAIDALGEKPLAWNSGEYELGMINQWESDVDAIKALPPAQPEPHYDEWCDDCKEYDKERHCCPRWNRVIRQALKDAQPEPHEGYWIPREGIDGDIQYECSKCGVLWEFNYGTPEDNEAYFCPKCGAKMKGVMHEGD